MLMYSFKFNRKTALIAICCVIALIAGVFVIAKLSTGETAETSSKKLQTAKTESQREAFVKQFGWEIQKEPAEVMEVIIPKEFDAVMIKYNDLQKTQGYDLLKYAGKKIKRWSYNITNYPERKEGVRISLLVYENKVIGGDVACLELNGFMHGFKPEVELKQTIVDAEQLEATAETVSERQAVETNAEAPKD